MTLERLWAGWRGEYVGGITPDGSDDCVFCRLFTSDEPDDVTLIVWRGETCAAILNLFPYTSGHLMLMPLRHVAELEDLSAAETRELWAVVTDAVRAIKGAYRPDGLNVGINLGAAGGAGVPGHFHVHCLPRWAADSNFMTTIAEARVIPEALSETYEKLTRSWPRGDPS